MINLRKIDNVLKIKLRFATPLIHVTELQEQIDEIKNAVDGIKVVDAEQWQAINNKMAFYEVTMSNRQIVHDGEVQTYETLRNVFDAPDTYLYMHYLGLNWLPLEVTDVEEGNAIGFIVPWYYNGDTRMSRVIINDSNVVKQSELYLEQSSKKVATIHHRDETNTDKYPSIKAIVDWINNKDFASKGDIPSPYDDSALRNAIQTQGVEITNLDSAVEDTKKDLGEFRTQTETALSGLETEKADRSEIPQPYDDTALKAQIAEKANSSTVSALAEEVGKKTEVFLAEYGVTTAQEVKEAYESGKTCYAVRGTYIFPLTCDSADRYYFGGSGIDGSTVMYVIMLRKVSSAWSATSASLDKGMSDPQDWYVPTSKAVDTYLTSNSIRTDKAQTLTEEQKKQARANIGDGEFEFIEEINVNSEGVTIVTRSTEPNGVSYYFKKAFVRVTAPTATLNVNIYYDGANNKQIGLSDGSSGMAVMNSLCDTTMPIPLIEHWQSASSAAWAAPNVIRSSNFFNKDAGFITGIRISGESAATFPVGSVIEIYAVRA